MGIGRRTTSARASPFDTLNGVVAQDQRYLIPIVANDRKATLLQHPQRPHVVLRHPREQRPLDSQLEERCQCTRSDAPVPVLAPDPVTGLALALVLETDDIPRDLAIVKDRPRDVASSARIRAQCAMNAS